MTRTIHGVVHGKTIEFEENLGLAEGQEVEITIKSVPSQRPWGEGLRRCDGALASVWTEDRVPRLLPRVSIDKRTTHGRGHQFKARRACLSSIKPPANPRSHRVRAGR